MQKNCKRSIPLIKICILSIFVLFFCSELCFASQNIQVKDSKESEAEKEEEQIEQDLLADLELEDVDRMVEDVTGQEISLTKMIKKLLKGGQVLEWDTWSDMAVEALQESVGIRKKTWMQILLLVLLSAVLTNLASVFENQQIGETSFYIIYLLLFVILLRCFGEFSDQLHQTLSGITEFMKALLPSVFHQDQPDSLQ